MTDANQYSPLVLAYLGDAVYELYVRKKLISIANTQVDKLHKAAVSYVKAEAQSEAFRKIENELCKALWGYGVDEYYALKQREADLQELAELEARVAELKAKLGIN